MFAGCEALGMRPRRFVMLPEAEQQFVVQALRERNRRQEREMPSGP